MTEELARMAAATAQAELVRCGEALSQRSWRGRAWTAREPAVWPGPSRYASALE